MIEKIKTLLKLKNFECDDVIEIYVSLVTQKVLNYCGISSLPEALNLIVMEMVINEYGSRIIELVSGSTTGKVGSVKRGDTEIVYDNKEDSGSTDFISNYRLQLDPFRRMKLP